MNVFNVTQLNKYIKNTLENDVVLQNIAVKGEVSNIKYHSSGHIYFKLKDATANINIVMFKGYARSLNFKLKDGDAIVVMGYVSIYEATGQFQLYCENIEPVGAGVLVKRFEELKEKLDKKGYFSEKNKKKVPKHVKTVVVITSPTGAAVHDIINTIQRRNPTIKIVIVPTLVQGNESKNSIAESISMADSWAMADVIIVGRGGGSMEDLWSFNEEIVADAIFKCKTPIISAVGHETDFTISDFVADMRASTPTSAGELISFELNKNERELAYLVEKLNINVKEKLNSKINQMEKNISILSKTQEKLYEHQLHLGNLKEKLQMYTDLKFNNKKNLYISMAKRLENLDVVKVINRGFAVVSKDGTSVNSVKNVNLNDVLSVKMYDGSIFCRVDEVKNAEEN
ncbi:MAG: exodeoxyribonuclease VII large subunit [Lachnospirales bacterium]